MEGLAAPPQFFAVYLRCAGAVSLLPISGPARGFVSKLIFTLALTLPFSGEMLSISMGAASELFGNFLLGMVLVLPVALLAQCAAIAGELFDVCRGQTIGNIYDPFFNDSETQLAAVARYYIWFQFLTAGGLAALATCLHQSFALLPGNISDIVFSANAAGRVFRLQFGFLHSTSVVFLPFALVFLVASGLSGMLAKVLPQYSPVSEQIALCSCAGFWLLIDRIGEDALAPAKFLGMQLLAG